MKIAIIGAGVAGLVTAKTLIEYGHRVVIFEKESHLGGVWSPSRHYPGMTTQNTRDTYAYSDFRMPTSYPEFPSGRQVFDYLTSYVKAFGFQDRIKTNHTITSAELKDKQWILKGTTNNTPFEETVDYLIVCSGTFSEPNIPHVDGMDDFIKDGGKVIHTTQMNQSSDYAGKRVAVIGFGKSACDVASAAADQAAETYVIYRQAKWKVPKKIMGINYKYFILSRFGEALTKNRFRSSTENVIHGLEIPSGAFSTFQKIFNRQQKLKEVGLYPDTSIKDQLFGELSVESDGFYKKVKEGKIKVIRSEVQSHYKGLIELANGDTLKLDTLIYGTGFRQELPFFSKETINAITSEQGDYVLYRNILPLTVPQLAFNGYNTSFFCTLTSEIGAQWIAEYLNKGIDVPSVNDMRSQIAEYHKWRKQFRLNSWFQGASVYPFNITYVDQLLKDMNAGLPWYSMLKEWMVVVDPSNYKRVKAKIKKRSLVRSR